MTTKQDIQALHAQVVSMSHMLSQMLTRLNTMLGDDLADTRTEPPFAPVESVLDLMRTEGGTRVPPSKPAEPEIVINAEWQSVLDLIENSTDHLFITGGAGVGKSVLLNYFTEHTDKITAIVAPTGAAALRVGGCTLHSFFFFGAHAIDEDDIRTLEDSRRRKYRELQILVIDEISMVRADLMDGVDLFLRKNGRDKNLPFGGVRIIMFGDLFQLPPVAKEAQEKHWLNEHYGVDSPSFFHANVWRDAPPRICTLTTTFRQSDPRFVEALNAIRVGKNPGEYLPLFNSRVNPVFLPPKDQNWITLTTTNASADETNRRMLAAIKSPSQMFEADVVGDFDLRNAPTDEHLELKVGASVVFIRKNKGGAWQNGTLGKVSCLDPLEVTIEDRTVSVEPDEWETITYEYNERTRKLTKSVKGKFIQIPVKLAAAITVHRSQGLTLSNVIVDLSSGAFSSGQTYVALSRCRTLEGMVLRRPLRESDLIINSEVVAFMTGQPIARPKIVAQLSMMDPK